MYGYNLGLGSGGNRLPRTGILFLARYPGLVDIIGLSVSDYDLLDPYWQAFFFDDQTTPKTDITAADVIADPNINIPGGNVFYSSTRDLVVIYGLPLPTESAERRLWKYMFDTTFEIMTENGAIMYDNGYQLYEVANA